MLIKSSVRADEIIISDMHIPYHHPDMLDFLDAVKIQYKIPKGHSVKCVGDEVDNHAMSFHDSDPDLMSAGDELIKAKKYLKVLYDMFPLMELVDSNHGSMAYRRAKAHGIPRWVLKSYKDILEAPDGWVWHQELTFDLSNGQKTFMCHGKLADVVKVSQAMGMNTIQGHYHEKFTIGYWGNPLALHWAMNVGCLIDDDSYAYAYNKVNTKRPIIGLGVIINACPMLIPLVKKKNGRWTGTLGHPIESKKKKQARKKLETM